MKYLEFYKSCMATGKLPDWGLCCSLEGRAKLFEDLFPDPEEDERDNFTNSFWGYNGEPIQTDKLNGSWVDSEYARSFTPLRQTIVLLLAAINGEL